MMIYLQNIIILFLIVWNKINNKMQKLRVHQKYLSPIQSKEDGIFDFKSYQKSFQRKNPSSAIGQAQKRLSRNTSPLSQQPYSRHKLSMNATYIKKQIGPHEVKPPSSSFIQEIKAQIQKYKPVTQDQEERKYQGKNIKKRSPFSSYVEARKKLMDRQLCNSVTPFPLLKPQQQSLQDLKLNINQQKKMLMIQKQQKGQANEELEENKFTNNYIFVSKQQQFKQALLQKILIQIPDVECKNEIIQKRIERKIIVANDSLAKKKLISFKKRISESQLIVNNFSKSKSSIDQPEKQQSFCKNFADQNNFEEEEIILFKPSLSKIQNKPFLRKQKHKYNDFNCKSLCIFHLKEGILSKIYGKSDEERLQIASMTKIMTCLLTLRIAEIFEINLHKQKVIISERASKMPGTSAKLAYADTCTIYQLLHALMLPSGNDAAIAIGDWGGKIIRRYSRTLKKYKMIRQGVYNKSTNFLVTFTQKIKSPLRLFIFHMNKVAQSLNLNNTFFVNTHGLMNDKAYSSAEDVCLLTNQAMKNIIFREIVSKKQFTCQIFNRTFSHSRTCIWINTNKLLGIQGFIGVKTGITPAAGPCLVSCFQLELDEYLFITILKTKNTQTRFKQSFSILKETLSLLGSSKQSKSLYLQALKRISKYDKIDLKASVQQMNDLPETQISEDFD